MSRLVWSGFGLCLALAGCAVGPDYARPALPQTDRYTEAPLTPTGTELPASWWQLFGSPPLNELVRSSLDNNPGVAAAQAALRTAIENVRVQRAAAYPSVDLDYTASRQKIADPLASPASSNADLYNLHTAQVSISYVPDVFGANRRQVESLQAQAANQRWMAEATYLTLTSNVVASAIQEAALRAQIDATRHSLAIQQDMLGRFERLQRLGQASVADVAQQEATLAALETNLPPLEKQLAQQRDLIKALSGQLPASRLDAQFTLESLVLPEPLPLTLPSTLVDHRPDVLAAEAQLQAANAAIGVAVANRLPSISLGVDAWGSAAYSLANLFKSGTSFWTLAGGITQPIFDAGALQHREAAARSARDEAEAQYRSTVIAAFQNVADALQAIHADADALRIADHALAAADHSLAIARRQFELGDVAALAVMQAEQASWQASIGVAQARANRLADTVALFQALGGGWWNRPAPPAEAKPRVFD